MKKIIYILIICNLHFAIYNLNAQWVTQNSATSWNLLDIEFINRNTGWACGEAGTIVKTTNGGLNWSPQNTGINNKALSGIHPVDANIVYCVGYFETILKSTNGGNDWLILRNGPWGQGASFEEVFFLNQNTGWMLKNYYIIRTTNGGITFDSTNVIYSYLRDIYFKDNLNGVLCGEGALIMKSSDGGVTWNKITIPLAYELPHFYKESFIDNTGWVVGAGTNNPNLGPLVWRTTNFGTNWDTIARVPYPYTHDNYCVFFSSLNTGWCGGSYGHIFKTTNGGFNWLEQVVPSQNFRNSMWFYNDSIGWAAGGGGQILHTTTGGQYVGLEKLSDKTPDKCKLFQNFPNPFNSKSKIKYQIEKKSFVRLIVYDVIGREMELLVNIEQGAGIYQVELNAENYPSGIYFYKLITNEYLETRKMILAK